MYMRLAAGLFTALAMGASVADGLLLFGLGIATALAGMVQERGAEPNDRVTRTLRIAALVGLLVVFATGFTAYVLPDQPRIGSAGFVVVLVVLHALGVRVSRSWQRWLTVALFFAAVGFVVLMLAGPQELSGGIGIDAGQPYTGPFVAAAVLFPFVRSVQRGYLVPAFLVTAAVIWATASQFTYVRWGLSPASLRDALVSADAGALRTVLVVLVALGTGSAAVRTLDELGGAVRCWSSGHQDDHEPDHRLRWQVMALGLTGLPVTAVVTPFGALVLAAALSLSETLVRVLRGPKTVLSVGALLLCGLLLGMLLWYVLGVV